MNWNSFDIFSPDKFGDELVLLECLVNNGEYLTFFADFQ